MTGKRPRALTRTASVSQLGSGSLEFSPLVENPKEKLKVSSSAGGGVVGARRVVIGFDPKPDVSPKSAPCSPCFNDDASSPRSVLGSLFSKRCVKPSDGVGLGIALQEVRGDHIAIPVREDVVSPPKRHEMAPRRHSHPIPTPGMSACHFKEEAKLPQPVARPVLGWLEQVDPRRDTFLLGVSPSAKDVEAALPPSGTTTTTTHFLDECSFCKRHLPEDKDIFMYRGDKAFCSVECRSQQMLMDERSKNCASSAFKRTPGSAAPSQRGSRVAPASSVAAA